MAATAALVPCLAALPRLASSPSSPLRHRDRAGILGDSARVLQPQLIIWGQRASQGIVESSGRCFCGTRSPIDESFTKQGNVVLFDEQASELEEFIRTVRDKLVVLDISTKTCGPCKFIFPKLVKLSEDYPDAVFLKINGDYDSETRALMRKWKIRAVPTFRFFKNGEMVHSHSGAKEDDLRAHFIAHYHSERVSI
ncbi:thioredoxin isoform X1 [Selaginella moellendorffii]|nr:thioredoxin isoform X1 [Selaginella moellendorffii]|eukprot:XP_002971310.2 thioredoxin isoform X1 [Selaginella moellendorffii]